MTAAEVAPRPRRHGRFTQTDMSEAGYSASSQTEHRIFQQLCRFPYGRTAAQLIDAIYGHRRDGGPDWAASGLTNVIRRMNKRWEAHGRSLRIHSRRNHFRYQIWIVR